MGLRKKIDNFLTSLIDNVQSYDYYYDTIKELSVSRFEWKNVPPEIDVRFLELMLFERGTVAFFYDDVLEKYICLPYAEKWGFTIYRKPKKIEAYAVNGERWKLDFHNSVYIYNNVTRTPGIRTAELFAKRLAHFDRTIDVNVHAQKTPVLIRCGEHERLSLQNLYMKYEGGQPIIYGDKDLSAQPLEAIHTDAPYVADKIYDLKTKYWNEMLTKLGISNVNYQKRERLISDEVNRGQGGTIANRYSGLLMRQQAADEINRMFGLSITVDYRQDQTDMDVHEMNVDDAGEQEGGDEA